MTIQEFINEVMTMATIFLRRGDHENYRYCIELIADAIYEQYDEINTVAEAKTEILEA